MIEEVRELLRGRTRTGAIVLALLAAALLARCWKASAPEHALLATFCSAPSMIVGGGECLDPASLPDGRVVYARVPGGADPDGPTALYTALADGGQQRRITFGDARDRAPAVLPDGRIVFRRHQRQGPGKLFAMNADGTGLQLFCEPAAGASIEGGPWLADDRLIFAERMLPGADEHRVSVSVHQPLGTREVLAGNVQQADHPAPRARPLSLTSVVDERKSTGTLLCLDVRTSRIPTVAGAQPGTIRAVRVLAVDGQVLGQAPVEADGSFFIEVPADQPLRLQLDGPAGVIAEDHSEFWVRPNENRGCIGCHEDPELAPENRAILALNRGPVPIKANVQVTQSEGRAQ